MTPVSPKGPEREARPLCNCGPCQREAAERNAPIPYLRRHVAEAIFDGLGIYNRPDADRAADLVVSMLRPELDRLTFERDFAQANLEEYLQQLQELRDDYLTGEPVPVTEVVSATKRELERITAEVERLRASRDVNSNDAGTFAALYRTEQARANELEDRLDKTEDTYSELLRGMADRASKLRRQADRWHRRAEQEFRDRVTDTAKAMAESGQQRVEVSRLREQLAPAKLGAAVHQERADQLVVGLLRLLDKDREIENGPAPVGLDEFEPGVSSSEVEAPQQEDETDALFGCDETWYNTEGCLYFNDGVHRCCVAPLGEPVHDHHHCTCGLWLWHGNEPPRVSATSEASQHQVEIRHTGGGYRADCRTCKDWFLSTQEDQAEDWKDQHEAGTLRPKLATGGLIEAGTLGLRDESGPPGFVIPQGSEGRPSGSERLAPQWREGDVVLDRTDFVQRRFESGWRTWPRETGVQYSDADMEAGLGPLLRLPKVPAETDNLGHVPHPAAQRVRQDAALAARSEATLEEDVADGYCDVCGCPMQYLHEPSCPELDSVPSPSLRKEGEDSGD